MGEIILGSETQTEFYLGVCEPCRRPVRTREERPSCLECGQEVPVGRLLAVKTDESCDGSCINAVGPSCSCACGGANHGANHAPTGDEVITEAALARYRQRREQVDAQRERRQAQKRERQAREFAEWAAGTGNGDLVEWLTSTDHRSAFLDDMAKLVWREKPLTDRQASAARAAMDRDRGREQEKREASPVPAGKGVTVEGTIVSVVFQESSYGGRGCLKMVVRGDQGWRVRTTAPSHLVEQMTNGFLARAQDVMPGRRVRLVAQVEAAVDDPSFGSGKRPRRGELLD